MPGKFSVLFGVSVLFVATAAAQNQGKQAASRLPGMTWSSLAELPDFTGVWEITRGGAVNPGAQQPILYTPKYAAILKAFQANPPQDSPAANCVPPGMPGVMTQPYPIEFLFTPGKVTILIEAYMQIRHIYTDGRKHPDDPDLTYLGHSIGRWEDKTLVVDSVGFTPDTPLGGNMGNRHSEKMHIVERIRLVNPDQLEISTTIDDPEALAQPFTRVTNFARHRDWTMAEYICQQNNRNSVSEDGKAGINLNR
jgi:hypothetical protein